MTGTIGDCGPHRTARGGQEQGRPRTSTPAPRPSWSWHLGAGQPARLGDAAAWRSRADGQSRCLPGQGAGRSCGAGFVPSGALHRRNSRCTWVASSSCTTSASVAKRCCLRSWSDWSRQTRASHKSGLPMRYGLIAPYAKDSSSAFASCRSAVSKPSVNQP